jgi:tetratricopeptide (TPR) repeat protein
MSSSMSRRFIWPLALLLVVASGCRTSPQAKEQRFFERGQAQMAKKDYARAALEFRSAAQAMPNDADPYYQLGLAALGMRDGNTAFQAFRKAVQLNPKHNAAQLKLAELMVASNRKELVEEAAANMNAVLAASPDNPEAVDTMALAEIQLGKNEDAAKRLEATLEKFPAHLSSSVALARLKLRDRNFPEAEAILKNAVASAPQSSPAALALAQLYVLAGQNDKAEAGFRKAIALDPKNATALLGLGALQVAGKRMDEADRTYQQAAALEGNKQLRPLHAIFLYRSGKQDAAVAELEKLAQSDPDDRNVRTLLVSAYVDRKRTDRALAVLSAALKRNSKDTNALLQKSELDLREGRVSQAEQQVKQVLHLEPNSAAAHYALAAVYRLQGSRRSENQELSDTLRANPGVLQARLLLAGNLRAQGQFKSALQVCDEAPAQQKNNLALLIERNWALMNTGSAGEVRSVLDRMLRAQRVPAVVLQEGALRLQQKDYAGARADAEEVLKANPEDLTAALLITNSYASEGRVDKGIERLRQLAEARPQSAPLHVLLGEWQARQKQIPEARKSFEAAKSADPAMLAADLALARLDIEENKTDAARQRLEAIAGADPKNATALLLLAQLEEQSGNRTGAVVRYRAVLAVDSANLEALNNLAYNLAQENPDEALPLAQQAAEMAPDNAAVQDTLGFVFYRKGDYRNATNYVKTAVTKEPTPRRQFHLAMCYSKSGDQNLAAKMLAAALQQDPNLTKTERGW